MLYDGRKPAAQRAFEILDPSTGERRTALDMQTAVASLNKLLPTVGSAASRSLAAIIRPFWPTRDLYHRR